MINAFSIDLEDWYFPELLRDKIDPQDIYSLIMDSTMPILNLLDKYNTKATFFVLGEVARRQPDLIRLIYSKGHEIASHGMSHKPLWKIDKNAFSREIDEFDYLMKDILGDKIRI